jgi:predicted dehydrogenase
MTSRIGIIGLGTIGKTHWRVTRESPETTLIAVADPTPSALDFARAASIPAYADYREMLENETLDGVIVAVPNAEHIPAEIFPDDSANDYGCPAAEGRFERLAVGALK